MPLTSLDGGPGAEEDAGRDGEEERLKAELGRDGEPFGDELVHGPSLIHNGGAKLPAEEAFYIFKILRPEGLIETKIGVERIEYFLRNHPIADERIARNRMHQKKGPRDDAPDGDEEDQSFFYQDTKH